MPPLDMDAQAAEVAGENEKADAAVSSQIRKYERRIEPPADVRDEIERWEDMRRYVHTDAMLLDEEDAVGTNFVLRNQHTACALIDPPEPAPRIVPRKWLPPAESDGAPLTYPPDLLRYAKTHEIVIEFQQKRGGLVETLAGAEQDAMTLPWAVVKMRVQEDFGLDPVGYGRNNDQLDLLKRYERLRRDYDEGLFTDTDARFAELRDLSNTIRAYILDELQTQIASTEELSVDPETGAAALDDAGEGVMVGADDIHARVQQLLANPEMLVETSDLPEVAHYVGYVWQQIDIEDFRWDWNIRRPEDLRFSRWMAHRVWMTGDDIREKWGVSLERLVEAMRVNRESDGDRGAPKSSSDSDPEYGGKDAEERTRGTGSSAEDDAMRGETYAVWEYWDRVQGRVYRWVQGTGFFLDDFVPPALPSRFFPFYVLGFNRVTGKVFGPSDTDLQSPLQDESNRMRTWQREAQKSAHPRWMISKGLLRPAEKNRFEQALPYSLTEVERADDLSKNIFPIIPPTYDPRLYDRTPSVLEMQQMAGLPAAALGAGNVGMTATSDAIANESMGKQVKVRRKAVMKIYAEIYEAMAEINAQILPEANVGEIAGPGAFWPEVDRQQVLSNFVVEAEAVEDDTAERGKELEAWVQIVTIAQQFGLPIDPIPLTKHLLGLMGIRDNIGKFISVPALLQTMGLPTPAGGNGGQGRPTPRGEKPDAQGSRGAEGGAPAGAGFSAPPAASSVPNSPA